MPQLKVRGASCQEIVAHQLPGSVGSLPCNKMLCQRHNITMLLRMYNTTAVAYVNKVGGTVSPKMKTIVKELWLWCMNRDITLVTEHLLGVLNTIAD